MKKTAKKIIQDAIASHALLLLDEKKTTAIETIAQCLIQCLSKGGKVLIFGNGGSAADSQHFAAELVGRFQKERRGLSAVALSTDSSVLTALANDYSFDCVFERQVEALARRGDVAFAISTSGRAKNVLRAIKKAKQKGLTTIGLTGKDGGQLARATDHCIKAPAASTARIQELHILIIHILCQIVENAFT
ncbi:MAG: D-sedoheptulose 7-phosphate isomerase [Candidatus Omnitrophota bacterium]